MGDRGHKFKAPREAKLLLGWMGLGFRNSGSHWAKPGAGQRSGQSQVNQEAVLAGWGVQMAQLGVGPPHQGTVWETGRVMSVCRR